VTRRWPRRLSIGIATLAFVFVATILLTLRPGDRALYPAPAGEPTVAVFVVSHGYHAGIVLPRATLAEVASRRGYAALIAVSTRFAAFPFLEMGWGDEEFYRSVPTIASLTVPMAARALFLPGNRSVVHVVGLSYPPRVAFPASDIIALGLSENLIDDPIAVEAQRAAAHFNYDPQATYIVMTPPSTIATGQPVYCGYHTQTTSLDGLGNPFRLQYSFIPFLNMDWPGLGTGGCGMNTVNTTSNAFGNGVFDGYSIVTGHEYSEAVTDPDNILSDQDGWNDAQGSENGDKCAWTDTQNIPLGTHQFAVQPLWSNEAYDATGNGCAVSR